MTTTHIEGYIGIMEQKAHGSYYTAIEGAAMGGNLGGYLKGYVAITHGTVLGQATGKSKDNCVIFPHVRLGV